ncbi:hypothetical protein [Wohlfahrtiimonas chitiniclastica]|nr:hypothetical protein [Wohlfahrtiimonas chitiniclastica]
MKEERHNKAQLSDIKFGLLVVNIVLEFILTASHHLEQRMVILFL